MTDIPIRYLLQRFAIVYLLATLALAVLGAVLEHVFGISTSSATGAVPLVVTAIDMGQSFFRKTGRVPEKYESWRLARWAAVISMGLSLILMSLFVAINPEEMINVLTTVGFAGMVLILGVFLLFSFLLIRFFVGIGAKGIAKASSPD